MVTLAVWLPTVRFGMIYEDRRDAPHTLDAGRAWQQMIDQPTRALPLLTRWAELRVCGVEARCFHAGNVLWHTANTLLVLVLAWLYLPPWGALAAGVIFALHPIQTEAVSYVSARGDLLATFGLLLALLAASLGSLAGAVVGVVLAILAKETAVVAWGLVCLWIAWTATKEMLMKLALVSSAGAVVATWWIWQRIDHLTVTLDSVLAGSQLANIEHLLLRLVLPVGFTIDHDWTRLEPFGPYALLLAIALTAWALTEGWWSRSWLAFGWLWTVIALSPRLVVPLYEGLHERHMTMVLIGWALCAGAWLSKTSALRIASCR